MNLIDLSLRLHFALVRTNMVKHPCPQNPPGTAKSTTSIEPLLKAGKEARDTITARAAEIGKDRSTLYRWLSTYVHGARWPALLPAKSGAAAGQKRLEKDVYCGRRTRSCPGARLGATVMESAIERLSFKGLCRQPRFPGRDCHRGCSGAAWRRCDVRSGS